MVGRLEEGKEGLEEEEIASCLLFPTPKSKLFYKMYVLCEVASARTTWLAKTTGCVTGR